MHRCRPQYLSLPGNRSWSHASAWQQCAAQYLPVPSASSRAWHRRAQPVAAHRRWCSQRRDGSPFSPLPSTSAVQVPASHVCCSQ